MFDVFNIIFNIIPDQKTNYIAICKSIKIEIELNQNQIAITGDMYSLLHVEYDYKFVIYTALIHRQINIVNYIIRKHQLTIGYEEINWHQQDKYLYQEHILSAIGYCGDETLINQFACHGFLFTVRYIYIGVKQSGNTILLQKNETKIRSTL